MDAKKIISQVTPVIQKYKYAVIILVIGIVLMFIPKLNNKAADQIIDKPVTVVQEDISTELERILSSVKGAGKVRIYLTTAYGSETIYQMNSDTSDTQSKHTTVMVTASDRTQSGLIRQINPPKYQGAIVVCSGADNPSVQLAIVSAVSKATGLGANQIAVLKMK